MKKAESKKILIGLSWPYANGRMHIGHVASSLPADALARYHRLVGNDVAFISGSDCYGTPILVAARAEGVTPLELSDKYHALLKKDFDSLGFTFDNYTKTTNTHHNEFVRNFHADMYKGGHVYQKSAAQLYCATCVKHLPDRYVEGICPFCEKQSKGDSCDNCGKIIEAEELKEPKCKLCASTPTPRNTRQLYLALSALEGEIQNHYDRARDGWANNALGLTGRYLREGLRDRAITRNIEWGVLLPQDAKATFGFEPQELNEKRIYIWAENVLGYFSACSEFCDKTGRNWEDFLLADNSPCHIYVHAKDNIPFHSIILPGLLLADRSRNWKLPDIIASSEYVQVGGAKLAKSVGNLITAEEMGAKFDVDMIRYYFLRKLSDKKDVAFTWEDFTTIVNSELVNGFGNLVNRSLSFINKNFQGVLNKVKAATPLLKELEKQESEYNKLMNSAKVKEALAVVYGLVELGNKHFDSVAPWKSIKTDKTMCMAHMYEFAVYIKGVAKLLEPFIPFASLRVKDWITLQADGVNVSPNISILFKRIEQ